MSLTFAGSTSLLEFHAPRGDAADLRAPKPSPKPSPRTYRLAQAFADRRLEEGLVAARRAPPKQRADPRFRLRRRASVALTSVGSSDEQPRYDDLTELQRDLIVASRSALSDGHRHVLAPLLENIKRWRAQHMSVVILSDEERAPRAACASTERTRLERAGCR